MKYNKYASLIKWVLVGCCLILLGTRSSTRIKDISVETLRKEGKILSAKISDTSYSQAIQITHIDGPVAELKEEHDSTYFYKVSYIDKNGRKSDIGLRNESSTSRLVDELEKANTLGGEPKWLIASVHSASDIPDYAKIMKSYLFNDENNQQLKYYITLSDDKEFQKGGTTSFTFFTYIAIFCILIGFIRYYLNHKRLNDFFKLYPELNETLDQIENNGGYVDPDIRVFFYKNHLVSYKSSFKTCDIHDALTIYHHSYSFMISIFPIIRKNEIRIVLSDGNEEKLPLRHQNVSKTDLALTRLKNQIHDKFPNIEL